MIWLAATASPEGSLGVLASCLALLLVWTHRSRFVPFWLPAEEWHRLERRSPGGARLDLVQPAEEEKPPEPEPAGFDGEGALREMQEQFEAAMGRFTRAAESEWSDLEHQLVELHARYQVVRGQLAEIAARGDYPFREPDFDVVPREVPAAASEPVEPPVELSGTGWGEPDEKGLRVRQSGEAYEYLGAPNQPDLPASPENPRPYYREARPAGFVEIARGVVAGRRLLITECARFLESPPAFAGEGRSLEPGGRLFDSSTSEAQALEKALWTLPADQRSRVGEVTFLSDLGGPVDWAGNYRADEEGFPRSFACLTQPEKIALRADLAGRPRLLARALRVALGLEEPCESGEHDGFRWAVL